MYLIMFRRYCNYQKELFTERELFLIPKNPECTYSSNGTYVAVHGHFKDLMSLKEMVNKPVTVYVSLSVFSEELITSYPNCSYDKVIHNGKEYMSITGHRAVLSDLINETAINYSYSEAIAS